MPSRVIKQYESFMLDKHVSYNFNGLGARHPDALIKFFTDDSWQAWVYFLPDDPIIEHYANDNLTRVFAFFPARQYTWTLDLLRNEGPCRFSWGQGRFDIWTGLEEAGSADLD